MAVTKYLGALQQGALGMLNEAAREGQTREEMKATLREAFPELHHMRAEQVLNRWERGVNKDIAHASIYAPRVEPGLLSPHRYIVKLTRTDGETGEETTYPLKIDSDRPLSPLELQDAALQRADELASLLDSPEAAAVMEGTSEEVEYEVTIHMMQE